MRRLRLSAAALTISISTLAIGLPVSAEAKVTRLEIDSKQSYGTFRSGEFVLWEGRVTGELRPSEKIPDLDTAPKNANGMVDYSAKISLIFPKNPKSGNGTLLVVHHSDFDVLIPSHSRIGKLSGGTRIAMLLGTPG